MQSSVEEEEQDRNYFESKMRVLYNNEIKKISYEDQHIDYIINKAARNDKKQNP